MSAAGCSDQGSGVGSDAGAETGTDAGLSLDALSGPELAYVGEEACFEVMVTPATAELSFFWGDGQSGAEPCHSWARAGHFLVGVQATSAGQNKSLSRSLLVVPRPLATPPTYSSPIVRSAAGDELWVVNPDSSSLARIDTASLSLVEELPVCSGPRTLALSGDWVAVACEVSSEVWQLRLSDRAVLKTQLPLGSAPYGIAADPRGGYFYVSELYGARVTSVPVGQASIGASVSTGKEPRGLAVLPDGRILVSHWRASNAGGVVSQLIAQTPGALAQVEQLALPPDVGLNSDTNHDGVPSFMNQVVPTPSGHQAFIPALKANTETGLFTSARALTFETTARAIIGILEVPSSGPELPAERAAGRYAFDDLDYASAAAFSPDGGLAYVAIQGSERVLILDAFSLDLAGSIRDVGKAPQGLVLSPGGERLYVQAFLSRSVRVYDVSDLSAGDPALVGEIRTVTQEPLSPEVLRGKQVFYSAVDPRMSRSSYLSCASCHLDGESDNLVWDFTDRGEGLRNTIPLSGRGGAALGALHWSANFDEVQDFEHDIRGPQQGLGFLSDAQFQTGSVGTTLGDPKAALSSDLDALAAYVRSLSGWGVSPVRRQATDPGGAEWIAARQLGEAIFRSPEAGCASCHTGSAFSDSGFIAGAAVLHDVGTLSPSSGQRLGMSLPGIDTPTLRGLWKSAPYLHDGSANTLRDVLTTRNPNDRHGATSQLTAAELSALEAYLLTLDDLEP